MDNENTPANGPFKRVITTSATYTVSAASIASRPRGVLRSSYVGCVEVARECGGQARALHVVRRDTQREAYNAALQWLADWLDVDVDVMGGAL